MIPSLKPSAALYSGSFDPPTRAHLAIVERAVRDQKVAKVVVVVNDGGSRKPYDCSVAERCAMFRASLPPDLAPFVDVIGEPASGKNALFDALARDTRYAWHGIIGDDSYATLPPEVRASRPWLVVDRFGVGADGPGVRHIALGDVGAGVSSSKVRELIGRGLDASALLPAGAAELIRAHGYYALPTGALLALRERTFNAICALLAGATAAIGHPPFRPTQTVGAMASYVRRASEGRVDLGGKPGVGPRTLPHPDELPRPPH